MTSQEIKNVRLGVPDAIWLREIAYQLAHHNETAERQQESEAAVRDRGGERTAAALRSCVQTIQENGLDSKTAVEYLLKYAEAVERHESSRDSSADPQQGKKDAVPERSEWMELLSAAQSYMENRQMYPGTSLKHDRLIAAIEALTQQGKKDAVPERGDRGSDWICEICNWNQGE